MLCCCFRIMNFIIISCLVSAIIFKEATSHKDHKSNNLKPYQPKHKNHTLKRYNPCKHKNHGHCQSTEVLYPHFRKNSGKRKHTRKDLSKSKEIIAWINKEIEQVKIPEENKHKVLEIEVDSVSGGDVEKRSLDHKPNEHGKSHKKFKITYERLDSHQKDTNEKIELSEHSGVSEKENDKRFAENSNNKKQPLNRAESTESDFVQEPVVIHLKKSKKHRPKSRDLLPSMELDDHSELIGANDDWMKDDEGKGDEKPRHSSTPGVNDEHIRLKGSEYEPTDFDSVTPKVYLKQGQHEKIGINPMIDIDDAGSALYYFPKHKEHTSTKVHDQQNGDHLYGQMKDVNLKSQEKSNTRFEIVKPKKIYEENDQYTSTAYFHDYSTKHHKTDSPYNHNTDSHNNVNEAVSVLKPLLMEALDEIKNTKHEVEDEHIGDKMESIKKNLNEKIELIRPTLLEVLNELKENKKMIKREGKKPPEDIIKPILLTLLKEIRESNKKTQEVLKELKVEKAQHLQEQQMSTTDKNLDSNTEESKESEDKTNLRDKKLTDKETDEITETTNLQEDFSQKNPKLPFPTDSNNLRTEAPTLASTKIYGVDEFNNEPEPASTSKEVNNIKPEKHKTRIHKQIKKHLRHNNRKHHRNHHYNNKHRHAYNYRANNNLKPYENATDMTLNRNQMDVNAMKTITKQKLMNVISELMAGKLFDQLKDLQMRNNTKLPNRRRMNPIGGNFELVDSDLTATSEKPVTVQKFEIHLG